MFIWAGFWHYIDLQKSECGGIQTFVEVHGTGEGQKVSTQYDKINRQIA